MAALTGFKQVEQQPASEMLGVQYQYCNIAELDKAAEPVSCERPICVPQLNCQLLGAAADGC